MKGWCEVLKKMNFRKDDIKIKRCLGCGKIFGCWLVKTEIKCKYCDIKGLSYCPSRWEGIDSIYLICEECEAKNKEQYCDCGG